MTRALPILSLLLAAGGALGAAFPARTGTSGLLDVPNSDTVPQGEARAAMDLMVGVEPKGTRAVFSPLSVGLGLGARSELGASIRVGGRPGDLGSPQILIGGEGKHHLIDAQGFRPGLALGVSGDGFNGRTRAGPRAFGSTERVKGWTLSGVAGADWTFKTNVPVSPALGVAASVVKKKLEVVAEVTHLYGGLLLGTALRWAVTESEGAMVGVDWLPSTQAFLVRLGFGFSTAGAGARASRASAPPEELPFRQPPHAAREPGTQPKQSELEHDGPQKPEPAAASEKPPPEPKPAKAKAAAETWPIEPKAPAKEPPAPKEKPEEAKPTPAAESWPIEPKAPAKEPPAPKEKPAEAKPTPAAESWPIEPKAPAKEPPAPKEKPAEAKPTPAAESWPIEPKAPAKEPPAPKEKPEGTPKKAILPPEPKPPPSPEKPAAPVAPRPESTPRESVSSTEEPSPPAAAPPPAPGPTSAPAVSTPPPAVTPVKEAATPPAERLRPGNAGKAQLRLALLKNETDIRRCVDSMLKRNPTFAGEGEFELSVDAEGKISKAGFAAGALRKTLLETCLQKTAAEWRFPFTGQPYQLSVPLSVRGKAPK